MLRLAPPTVPAPHPTANRHNTATTTAAAATASATNAADSRAVRRREYECQDDGFFPASQRHRPGGDVQRWPHGL